MRLLKITDGKLEFSITSDVPPYAILSHTWGEEEITYSDLKELSQKDLQRRKGYKKISFAKSQAIRDGYQYIWIDACCIDKSSSAELSEAINSMFDLYRNAAVCYTYLSDVTASHSDDPWATEDFESSLSRSRWFTRGWTLQELLAPAQMNFYAYPWTHLGSREGLLSTITRVTGIPKEVCLDPDSRTQYSVAQRLSWAARRQTTEPEDMAYCLLGILGVKMPILYGEGSKAFLRLQECILQQTADLSLFAWETTVVPDFQIGSILADSPSAFEKSGNIVFDTPGQTGLCMTHHKWALVHLPMLSFNDLSGRNPEEQAIGLLPCRRLDRPDHILGLPLFRTDSSRPWKRISGKHLGLMAIEPDQAKKAKFETFELETGVSNDVSMGGYKYLEYFGRVDWSSLLWNGWYRTTEDIQQNLWNTALKKAMKEFWVKEDASKSNSVALTISISEIERRNQSSHAIAEEDCDSQRPSLHTGNSMELQLEHGSTPVSNINMALTGAKVISTQWGDLNAGNKDQSRLAIVSVVDEADVDNINHSQPLEKINTVSRNEGGLVDRSSLELRSNPEDTKMHHIQENIVDSRESKRQVIGYTRGKQENGEEDYQSLANETECNDASSIASLTSNEHEESPLLNAVIDVLVDIIMKRDDVMNRILGRNVDQDSEGYLSDNSELTEPDEDTTLPRGRKRKADIDI